MFTGIVERLAEVIGLEPTPAGSRMTVKTDFAPPPAVGDSIAVNGVCLTVVANDHGVLAFDAVGETLARSNLGVVAVGDTVNLERPMAANGRFDGHIVQGHVDGTGSLASRDAEGEADRLRVELDPGLARYVVEKGSVTVDGVSLTVTAVGRTWFEFVVIPHTLGVTTLGARAVGERVNIEVDILAKYVERLLEANT